MDKVYLLETEAMGTANFGASMTYIRDSMCANARVFSHGALQLPLSSGPHPFGVAPLVTREW